MDYSVHRTYKIRPIIMAVLMIAAGILTIMFRYDNMSEVDGRNIARIISGVVLVVFGGAILLPQYREIMPTVGLMCFGLGISRFIVGVTTAQKHDLGMAVFQSMEPVIQVFGYIIIIFSLYMIYRGSNFMRMDAMNAFVMRFTTMGIIIGYILIIVYTCEFVPLVDLHTFWVYRRDFLTTPFLYLMYFILLCSKEVYDLMYWNKVRTSISRIADRINPGLLTTTYEDYAEFKERYADTESWDKPAEGAPVERELHLYLEAEGPRMKLLLEKWKDSDGIAYSLVPGDEGPYIAAQRGTVRDVEFFDDEFIIYGPEHMAMRITVGRRKDAEESMEDVIPKEVTQ